MFYKKLLVNLLLLLILMIVATFAKTSAEEKTLEGGIYSEESKTLESGITKEFYKNSDVAVVKVAFYYHPDAEVNFELLKQEGQKQYPHLLGYKEIDGLYRKALSTSMSEEELTQWKFHGGAAPYYLNAGAHIKNTGDGALTDVKIKFSFDINVTTLKANPASITTDYNDLIKSARWQPWTTKTVTINVLPPGENQLVQTESLSLCSLLEKLNKKWPYNIRVRVQAFAPGDTKKGNNSNAKVIKVIPDHFVLKTLR